MANFSVLHPRMFNLSDPGTMKTLSSLWAADWLMKQHPPGTMRCLIVGTLSTLETTWAKEIFVNFMGRRTCEILHGTEPKRLAALAKPADFYIVNHDGVGVGAHTRKKFELDGFSKALAEREDIQIVIADEASAYKDAQTKRHRIARLVIAKRPFLWLLTGSPTPTSPTDAYGLGKLVNNAFGKSFGTFQAETMLKVSQFRWVPQRDGYDKASKLLSPAIRIPIDAVWQGPQLVTEQREVALTPQQIKLMKDLKNDLQVTLKQGQPISAVNEASARQKFLQISLGAVYDSDHKVHLVDAGPRYAERALSICYTNDYISSLRPRSSMATSPRKPEPTSSVALPNREACELLFAIHKLQHTASMNLWLLILLCGSERRRRQNSMIRATSAFVVRARNTLRALYRS